jgi:hypothetical protein
MERKFELILKLIDNGHINMSERLELRSNEITVTDLKNALKHLIEGKSY